ncbi:hypothetical protein C8Q76DRAFT_438078 [Earliella scabrosa]|nr:hypothetical protein C8Q76DRAFT_438078 [Earliella scabrosa]
MIQDIIAFTLPVLRKPCFVSMVVLLWGFAWFAMSVLIFALGCFVPSVRPKPPPVVSRPRSPRINPTPVPSPTPVTQKPLPVEPDDVSSQSSTSEPRSSISSAAPSKRPSFKAPWSLPVQFKPGRPAASPKSSVSDGSTTLVGSSSPTRFYPDLPVIESVSPSSDPTYEEDASSPTASSSNSPSRPSRGVRLPSMKMFKTLSRKMTRQKTDPTTSPSVATAQDLPCKEEVHESEKKPAGAQPKGSTSEDEQPRQAQPGHLNLHRRNTASGEMFTSTFVSPFRIKPRKAPPAASGSIPPSPTPHRPSAPRRMLTSLHISLQSNDAHMPVPDSPRSSVSSSSTAVSTFSSLCSSPGSASSPGPRTVPRTQPYGPPYFAAMPTPSQPQAARSGSRPPSRRAASLSLDRPETVAEESGEDGGSNALGLELGQVEKPVKAQTEPRLGKRRPLGRHQRAAASESGPAGSR